MRLFSHEFPDSGFMPTQTSFAMGNVKPVLYVDAIPKSCRSLSITCIDHDAAKVGGFVHWLAWNIDTSQSEIITDAAHGAVEGNNDWGTIGWGGPQPPVGTHRYTFTLYAVDTTLQLESGSYLSDLAAAIKGHILERSVYTGLYTSTMWRS